MTGYSRRTAGGADRLADAELQADVMRFVAILALCLVGISTLVDRASVAATETVAEESIEASVPAKTRPPRAGTAQTGPSPNLSPGQVDSDPAFPSFGPEKGEPRVGPLPVEAPPQADVDPETPSQMRSVKMEPAPSSSSPSGLPVVDGAGSIAPARDEPPAEPARAAATQETQTTPGTDRGLMLRFESDAALLRMVGRGEAGVFVLAGREVFALDISRGVTFRPAPSPSRMHIITPDTVPALLRAEYRGPAGATWGVTLPGATLDAMRPFVERGEAGILVISADGSVRLETDDA